MSLQAELQMTNGKGFPYFFVIFYTFFDTIFQISALKKGRNLSPDGGAGFPEPCRSLRFFSL